MVLPPSKNLVQQKPGPSQRPRGATRSRTLREIVTEQEAEQCSA